MNQAWKHQDLLQIRWIRMIRRQPSEVKQFFKSRLIRPLSENDGTGTEKALTGTFKTSAV